MPAPFPTPRRERALEVEETVKRDAPLVCCWFVGSAGSTRPQGAGAGSFEQASRDVCEPDHLVDGAAGDRLARHAEDDAALFVLGDRGGARCPGVWGPLAEYAEEPSRRELRTPLRPQRAAFPSFDSTRSGHYHQALFAGTSRVRKDPPSPSRREGDGRARVRGGWPSRFETGARTGARHRPEGIFPHPATRGSGRHPP